MRKTKTNSKIYKNKSISHKKKHIPNFLKVSPNNLLKLFSTKNVALVNTLDNNIVINTTPLDLSSSYGKDFINKTCNQLNKYTVIILYCANHTCNASYNYAVNLFNKCKSLKQKIFLYEGGIHEWALLSFSFPTMYTFGKIDTNSQFSKDEIYQYFIKMNHRDILKTNSNYPNIIIKNQSQNIYSNKSFDSTTSNITCDNLKDKVCVVTGGTSGLGLEVVKLMLRNGAKHVTLTYFHDTKRAKNVQVLLEKEFSPCRFYILKADVRTKEGNILTFDRNVRKKKLKLNVGPIDCVDINAGIFGPANIYKKHIFNISESDYKKTIDTNLTGYFLALKYFVKQALENNVTNASAVCIKSIYGSTGSLFSNTAYQTSKHGVMGLVRQSAIELARPNKLLKIKYPIRINAVSPTFTNTALTRPFLNKDSIGNAIREDNPSGNLATKQDVANAVIFLLSDRANSITGIDLPVDCGTLAESIPKYKEVNRLNNMGIEELSCCGNNI